MSSSKLLRMLMAEGEEHWRTFRFVKDWLTRHTSAEYLRAANLQPPPAGNGPHATLQQRYRALLDGAVPGLCHGHAPRRAAAQRCARVDVGRRFRR